MDELKTQIWFNSLPVEENGEPSGLGPLPNMDPQSKRYSLKMLEDPILPPVPAWGCIQTGGQRLGWGCHSSVHVFLYFYTHVQVPHAPNIHRYHRE